MFGQPNVRRCARYMLPLVMGSSDSRLGGSDVEVRSLRERASSSVGTLQTACGTLALILGALMVVFGLLEALGVKISGDVSPGRTPLERMLIGVALCAVSWLLTRVGRTRSGQ